MAWSDSGSGCVSVCVCVSARETEVKKPYWALFYSLYIKKNVMKTWEGFLPPSYEISKASTHSEPLPVGPYIQCVHGWPHSRDPACAWRWSCNRSDGWSLFLTSDLHHLYYCHDAAAGALCKPSSAFRVTVWSVSPSLSSLTSQAHCLHWLEGVETGLWHLQIHFFPQRPSSAPWSTSAWECSRALRPPPHLLFPSLYCISRSPLLSLPQMRWLHVAVHLQAVCGMVLWAGIWQPLIRERVSWCYSFWGVFNFLFQIFFISDQWANSFFFALCLMDLTEKVLYNRLRPQKTGRVFTGRHTLSLHLSSLFVILWWGFHRLNLKAAFTFFLLDFYAD